MIEDEHHLKDESQVATDSKLVDFIEFEEARAGRQRSKNLS